MNRKKLVVGIAGGAAALSLIGAGAGATFSDKVVSSQTITRGTVNLLISSDNNNDYYKATTFAPVGPITSAAQTISKNLYFYNSGNLDEKLAGLVCNTTGENVTVYLNGESSALGCNAGQANTAATAGIVVPAGQTITVPVAYVMPQVDGNSGGSMPDTSTEGVATGITLAIHATD